MAEIEEVSKAVPGTVAIDAKCGPDTGFNQDLPKPEPNGTNQSNDLDKSYVFVDVGGKSDAESGKIRDPQIEKVNGNVDPSNGDPPLANECSLEDNGKGIRFEDPDRNNEEVGGRNEIIANGESPGFVENKGIGVCVTDYREEDVGESEISLDSDGIERVGDPDGNNEKVRGRIEIIANGDAPGFVENKGIGVCVTDSREEYVGECEISLESDEIEQVGDPDGNNEKVGGRIEIIANGEYGSSPGFVENKGNGVCVTDYREEHVGESEISLESDEIEQVGDPDENNEKVGGRIEITANGEYGTAPGFVENKGIGVCASDSREEHVRESEVSLESDEIEEVGDPDGNNVKVGGRNEIIISNGEYGDERDNIESEIEDPDGNIEKVGGRNEITANGEYGDERDNLESEVEQLEDSDENNEKVEGQNEIIGNGEYVDERDNLESEIEHVEDPDGNNEKVGDRNEVIANGEYGDEREECDDEVMKSDSAHKGSGIEVLDLVDDGEECESKDVSVGPMEEEIYVVECDLQDMSVKGEGEMKLSGEVLDVAEDEIHSSNYSDFDLESNSMNKKEETGVDEDIVECESQDLGVKVEDAVKLSGEVVESEECEFSPSTSSLDLNLESNLINSNEETDVVDGVVELEVEDVGLDLDLDLESSPINTNEESVVVENVVYDDSQSGQVLETAEHEIPQSNSLDLDLELDSINIKEQTEVVEQVLDCELQDVNVKIEDEVESSGEVVESEKHEVPLSTSSLDLDRESHPINTKDEIDVVVEVVECESQDVNVKVKDAEEIEVPLSTSLDLDSESNQLNPEKERDVVANVVDCELEDANVKAKNEVKILEEVTETAENEVPLSTSLDLDRNPFNTEKDRDVVENVVDSELEDANVKTKNEVKILEEVTETAENEVPLSTFLDLDSNPLNSKREREVVANIVDSELEDASVKGESEVPSPTSHVKLEQPEVHAAIDSGENSSDVTFTCTTEVSDSSSVNKEGTADIELETGSSNDNLFLGENENGNSQDDNTPVIRKGGYGNNVADREEASVKTKRKPFNFLIRVPRFDDESLREQTRLAKVNIEEKTKIRDAIQVQIQEKRASTQIHGMDFEYAKGEGRNARKLVRSKRMEIDSLQSVINKAKNALSIKDIDSQICNMERMIQHETLALKEEKQLIREIKQLKQLREQLSYNMGSQDEIKQALEQREEVEDRIKILRKELDVLKDNVLKAEAVAVEAEKKYNDENKKVKELQALFRAADDVRQEAYFQWHSLRKELSKKSQHFFNYKDDAAVANNLVFSRNTEALYRLCMNNVESFMELWNTNKEFRGDYVKFNARSTVRRFGSLDGRARGPDEDPPILPSYVERVNRFRSTPIKVDPESEFPALEPKQERTNESVDKPMKKVTEEKCERVTTNKKEPTISVQANSSDSVSVSDITYEEPKKSREEIEAIKKAEERERQEAEAKLKEERRLEALAKAHEARERKKKQAEKLQMRAELQKVKEAEQKEKEREKRLRKKERKKAAATDTNDINNCEIAPSAESSFETSKESELVKDVSSSVTAKKPKRNWFFGKQGKTKTVPPPLRNRNKKKLQQWMWVGITSAVILVLFWLGNIGVFSNVNFKRRSPVI